MVKFNAHRAFSIVGPLLTAASTGIVYNTTTITATATSTPQTLDTDSLQ